VKSMKLLQHELSDSRGRYELEFKHIGKYR
jgi:hypothetical protein